MTDAAPRLSVVVPLFDEEESFPAFWKSLSAALERLGRPYEVVLVDDGSRDGTWALARAAAAADPRVKALRLRRNFGQTAALAAGFESARGEVLVAMDGDGQNDPDDLPLLLEKLDQGHDVVSGWRRNRQDAWLTRVAPSWLANKIISWATGISLHDFGCTLKAYRRDVVQELPLYGDMHRFLPALALQAGARVAEVPVRHHPRRGGRSKYGLGRVFRVVLDLMAVKFLGDFAAKPLRVFGSAGALLCLAGAAAAGITLWQKLERGVWVHRNPLLLVAVFLFSLGANVFLMGLLAELVIRVGFRPGERKLYRVRESVNL